MLFILKYNEASYCYFKMNYLKIVLALAGVAQWIEFWPVNQRSPIRFPVRELA